MTPRGRAARARLWLTGLVLAALVLGPAGASTAGASTAGTPQPARPRARSALSGSRTAVTTEPDVRFTLASVTPAVARAGQDVRVTVTVANGSDDELVGGSVVALLNGRDLRTRAAVSQWATTTGTGGARLLSETRVPDVAPATARPVTLTVPAAQIATGRSYAVCRSRSRCARAAGRWPSCTPTCPGSGSRSTAP